MPLRKTHGPATLKGSSGRGYAEAFRSVAVPGFCLNSVIAEIGKKQPQGVELLKNLSVCLLGCEDSCLLFILQN